jgi:serine protease inhibitor
MFKAFILVKIIVDEHGTEAAAATGMVGMMRMAMMPIMITADHPFLFFIRYKEHTLFYGRLVSV